MELLETPWVQKRRSRERPSLQRNHRRLASKEGQQPGEIAQVSSRTLLTPSAFPCISEWIS